MSVTTYLSDKVDHPPAWGQPIHPSIFFHFHQGWVVVEAYWGVPGLLLTCSAFQLLLGVSKAFPGWAVYVIPLAIVGSTLGPSPR